VDVQPLLDLISAVGRPKFVVLVGVGGHGAAGKSTLARLIPDSQLVSIDAFWDGERFALERVRREVVEPLRVGLAARYEAWDWAGQRPAGVREVEPSGVVVVAGVCALHVLLRDAYDVRVWVEAPRDVRLARAVARDGKASRREWEERWMPSEDRYVERDDPIACAHLVIDNSEPLGLGLMTRL
jgi:uridine kinase